MKSLTKADFKIDEFDGLIIKSYGDKNKQELIKEQILKNQELRYKIVDLADIWDGKESGRYGDSLQHVLNDLGIKDIPEFLQYHVVSVPYCLTEYQSPYNCF